MYDKPPFFSKNVLNMRCIADDVIIPAALDLVPVMLDDASAATIKTFITSINYNYCFFLDSD